MRVEGELHLVRGRVTVTVTVRVRVRVSLTLTLTLTRHVRVEAELHLGRLRGEGEAQRGDAADVPRDGGWKGRQPAVRGQPAVRARGRSAGRPCS